VVQNHCIKRDRRSDHSIQKGIPLLDGVQGERASLPDNHGRHARSGRRNRHSIKDAFGHPRIFEEDVDAKTKRTLSTIIDPVFDPDRQRRSGSLLCHDLAHVFTISNIINMKKIRLHNHEMLVVIASPFDFGGDYRQFIFAFRAASGAEEFWRMTPFR